MSHDDGDPDNDPALQSLRSVWLSMPDEEPPARGLSELMAAARVKAEEMAKPSLWQRIVDSLRRPPVLALATVMVLIGGAVLIGQRGDQMEAQPASEQVGSPAPVVSAPAAPAPAETTVQGSMQAPGGDEGARANAAPMPGAAEKADRAADRGDDGYATATPNRDVPAAEPSPPPTVSTSRERVERGRPRPARRPAPTQTPKRPTVEATGTTRGVESKPSVDSLLLADEAEDQKQADKEAAPTAPPGPPSLATLHGRARAAATRGDCATVRSLAQQIAKRDARYHREQVRQDAALASCLQP